MSLLTNSTRGAKGLTRKKINAFFLLIVLALNSQMLSYTISNPYGIRGVQEVFIFFLIIFTGIYFLAPYYLKRYYIRSVDYTVFLLALLPAIYSTLAANLTFNQPIEYGFIEERRFFLLWIYFPIIWGLRNGSINYSQLERMVVFIALICATLIIGNAMDIIPSINTGRISGTALREERYSVGVHFIILAILMLFAQCSENRFKARWPLLGIFLFLLLVLVQGRQLIIGLAVSLAYIFGGLRLAAVLGGLAIFASIFLPLILPALPQLVEFIENLENLFGQIISTEYLTESWRARSINIVLTDFGDGALFGHGALSPLWNGGFSQIHGIFFYLADIGIFGSLYRFGIFSIFLYVIYLRLQFKLLRNTISDKRSDLLIAIFLSLIVLLPVSAPLESRGFITGFLLAITSYLAESKKAQYK